MPPKFETFSDHFYAESIHDEVVVIRDGIVRRSMEALETGFSMNHRNDRGLMVIDAGTTLHRSRVPFELPDNLTEDLVGRTKSRDPSIVPDLGTREAIRIRTRTKVRYVQHELNSHWSSSSTIGVESASDRIVTTPEHLGEDLSRMISSHTLRQRHVEDPLSWPMVWNEGTGAILLHESLAHPLLEGAAFHEWPPWLTVTDEPRIPGLGYMPVDDTGSEPDVRVLTLGEVPASFRRQGFREPAAQRMSNLFVSGFRAPFDLPETRLEIMRAHDGSYDSASDIVEIHLIGKLVEKGVVTGWTSFPYRRQVASIVASLAGATGSPTRYPGTICSEDGQRVAVGSWSCTLLTGPASP